MPKDESESLLKLLLRLWQLIGRRRQLQFSLLLLLMVVASMAEVLTIGIVLPFLMALAEPTRILAHPLAQPLLEALNITQTSSLLLMLSIVFCAAAVLSGLLRSGLLWSTTRLSCATGADISIGIYRRTLYQPYLIHVARNTSEVVAGVTIKTNHVIGNVFGPALTLVSSAIMLTAVVAALLAVDPVVAMAALAGFGVIYVTAALATRKRAAANSERISIELNQAIKSLNEGLSGIRDVLIEGAQAVYCDEYHSSDLKMRRAQASLLFVSQLPRYLIEALGMVLIALIAYSLALREGGIIGALPVLGALALGAQRLLPVMQQAYAAWSSIQGGRSQLRDTVELMEMALPEIGPSIVAPLPFLRELRLKDVSFCYTPDSPKVLNRINLTIRKGERVGFIGTSGSGKSTLLDMIMGLLPASAGQIVIDGVQLTTANQRAWQSQLAHVPQSIFLTDRSVAENIAFGQPKSTIDIARVHEAANQARIADLIESWPEGYDTALGERGIRLSGGQRQRIGIARALYKRASIIVLDEATSALDSETEEAVMKSIETLSTSLTILVIAHRLSTLRICGRIIELGGQGVRRTGSWTEIVGEAADASTTSSGRYA
jgi:ABC-type bacteriocin/lantibiotic exporter with double-glycine peptidase domain